MPQEIRSGHPKLPGLRREMRERHVSVYELSRAAGLHHKVIYDALAGEAVYRSSLRKIAEALAKFPTLNELERSLIEEEKVPA